MTLSELRSLVASRTGISEKEVGTFLNALLEQLTDGLRTDQQVKISGLGTFRLQAVAPRKSVNVVSGETFTIEGYNKILFNSESGVRELLQATSSPTPATEDEYTPLKKLGEQAEEIVDLLAELGQKPGEETETETQTQTQTETMTEEPEIPENPESPESPETPETPENLETLDTLENLENPEEPKETKEEEPKEEETKKEEPKEEPKKYHFWRDLIISVLILLLILGIGFYFAKGMLAEWIGELQKPAQTEVKVEEPEETDNLDNLDSLDNLDNPDNTAAAEAKAERTYDELLATEEMHQDSRLAWMAYRYYGKKDLWVYIYDANRDVIADPNHVEVGTPIRIPKLSAEQMDVNSAQTQALIEQVTGKR